MDDNTADMLFDVISLFITPSPEGTMIFEPGLMEGYERKNKNLLVFLFNPLLYWTYAFLSRALSVKPPEEET